LGFVFGSVESVNVLKSSFNKGDGFYSLSITSILSSSNRYGIRLGRIVRSRGWELHVFGRSKVAVFLQSKSNPIYLSMRVSCNKSDCSFNQTTTHCNQLTRLPLHSLSWLTCKTCSKGYGTMTRFKLTRRDFLKAAGSFGVASMLASGGTPAQTAGRGERKPNLLFIWTDEQRYNTMAAYGNEKIRTPNLNRLADKSVVFKKAYVTQPVCTPARSSVMTGMWPHQNGCLKNNIPLRKETKCLPELLDDPEYRSAYMGKWHLGDEIFLQHGFDEWVSIEDNYIAYYSEGRNRNLRSDYHHFLVQKGYEPGKRGTFGFPAGQSRESFCPVHQLSRAAHAVHRAAGRYV